MIEGLIDKSVPLYIACAVLFSYLFKKTYLSTGRKFPVVIAWRFIYIEMPMTIVVLILSAILAVVFYFIDPQPWENYLISYGLATSFYEVIIKRIRSVLDSKLNKNEPTTKPPKDMEPPREI